MEQTEQQAQDAVTTQMYAALAVIVSDPKLRTFLKVADPQALRQVAAAGIAFLEGQPIAHSLSDVGTVLAEYDSVSGISGADRRPNGDEVRIVEEGVEAVRKRAEEAPADLARRARHLADAVKETLPTLQRAAAILDTGGNAFTAVACNSAAFNLDVEVTELLALLDGEG